MKKKLEEMNIQSLLKKTENTADAKAATNALIALMEKYDIKHPLRGDK